MLLLQRCSCSSLLQLLLTLLRVVRLHGHHGTAAIILIRRRLGDTASATAARCGLQRRPLLLLLLGLGLGLRHLLQILDPLEHAEYIDGVHLAQVVCLERLRDLFGHPSAGLRDVGFVGSAWRLALRLSRSAFELLRVVRDIRLVVRGSGLRLGGRKRPGLLLRRRSSLLGHVLHPL